MSSSCSEYCFSTVEDNEYMQKGRSWEARCLHMLQVLFQSEFPIENTENSVSIVWPGNSTCCCFRSYVSETFKVEDLFSSFCINSVRSFFLTFGTLGEIIFSILIRKIGSVGNNKSVNEIYKTISAYVSLRCLETITLGSISLNYLTFSKNVLHWNNQLHINYSPPFSVSNLLPQTLLEYTPHFVVM